MARTPLFSQLRRLMRTAQVSQRTGVPAAELLEFSLSRRHFLQAGAGGAALALAGCRSTAKDSSGAGTDARVVIVGAGMAGLNCAWKLHGQRIDATIYEAADRTGGRMFSKEGLLHEDQTVELGGEFIDTPHKDMFALVKEFKLEFLDMQADPLDTECAYYFGGRHYSDREVLEALKPHVERMSKDAAWLEKDWSALQSDRVVRDLDQTSIRAYLEGIGVTGWLKDLLEVAFVTEYGLDADQQSAFNLLCIIGLDVAAPRWESFGESDERYKVKGGNQRVVDELAKRLDSQIHTGHRLTRLKQAGSAFALSFDKGGTSVEVKADFVVMTVPFSVLRDVELKIDMPDAKRLCINELGYGTNAKVIAGVKSRPWRAAKASGNVFSDLPFQLGWDNSRMQGTGQGGVTMYSGGAPGVSVGKGTPREQVERLLPGYDKVFAGSTDAWDHKVFRMHWPSHAFTKGSYACYRPGQWTTIAGHEIEPVGNLLFAGEHCSEDFQGFMQGAAETGRVAAEEILARVAK